MSRNYSQKELLLLSNFVYIPACRSDETIGRILDEYRSADGSFTDQSVLEAARGGGMSVSDVRTVFCEMDEHISENPDFAHLSATRRLEEKDVRAICYTDPSDRNPVVVFRGTGGTREAWTDNFEGAFNEETGIQKVADDFVRYECAVYDEIVVTGHSKGGNLAQFVTVKQADRVLECISYDGQGFGDELIRENADAVKAASPKITSISAYNDFVNILLTCIAGTTLYVANDASAAGAHSSVTLLTENTFDEEGNFTSIRSQGAVASALSRITGMMCDILKPVSEKDKETMSAITGSAISLALSSSQEDVAEECMAPVLGMITAEFVKKTTAEREGEWSPKSRVYGEVGIDADTLFKASCELRDSATAAQRIASRVNDQRRDITYLTTSRLCAEKALERVYEDIMVIRDRLEKIAELSERVSSRYADADRSAAELVMSVQ